MSQDGDLPTGTSGPVVESAGSGSETAKVYRKPGFVRRWGTRVLAVIGALTLIAGVGTGGYLVFKKDESANKSAANQAELQPFYTPPDTIPPKPGTIIRSDPMSVDLPNGSAYRVLYTSLDSQNKPVAVSGMIFVPTAAAPAGGGRKVVAWAHGTVGIQPQCAPSRTSVPLQDSGGWLGLMMDRGWVVAATDYYGLGTPGPSTYLVGQQEAKDVVNSVRAARNLPQASAGNDWIVWGHSQGGHSSLWTAALAKQIAPELNLLAVGAAAPAQQMLSIIQQQWQSVVGWTIGAEAAASFQQYRPNLDIEGALSEVAKENLQQLDDKCILAAGVSGAALDWKNGPFFNGDPLANPIWVAMAEQQTPPMPPKGMPTFMSEGTKDEIVVAGTNANMQVEWCQAGVNMSVQWIGLGSHIDVANNSGPTFVEWANSRFEGKPNQPNCSYPPASTPIPVPTINKDVQQQADAILKANPLPPIVP